MIKEYRQQAKGTPDLLNYCLFVAEGVLLLKDGSFCAGFYYRGPDLNSSHPDEISSLAASVNRILLKFGSGWMLHADLIRQRSCNYVLREQCSFPDELSALIDEERREHYLNYGQHYESYYVLVLTWQSPSIVSSRVHELFKKAKPIEDQAQQHLKFFQTSIQETTQSLEKIFTITPLQSKDLLQHLHTCMLGISSSLYLPPLPIYIDYLLGQFEITGGLAPKISNQYLKALAIIGYPLQCASGVLAGLEQLPIAFRWSNRFVFIDPLQAQQLIKAHRRYWFQKRHSFLAMLKQTLSPHHEPYFSNQDALAMSEDANIALAEADSELIRYGFYTSVIILLDEDIKQLETSCAIVRKFFENQGFMVRIETINALEAYLGSLPGHGVQNLRKPLIHTLNLADFLPLTSVWPGYLYNPCRYFSPQRPPLLYAATNGVTPFRLHLHVQDVGHTLIVGDTGSGKSTLLGLLAVQFLRYQNAQVYIFDKGYSSAILCRALHGQYFSLADPFSEISFCPLAHIDNPKEFAYAYEWLLLILNVQGLECTVHERKELLSALKRLAQSQERTLTALQSTLQNIQLKDALDYYTLSGPEGKLFDGTTDSFIHKHFHVFEMSALLEKSLQVAQPLLFYLFWRIEQSLKGYPTLIFIEEGHRFLTGQFGERLELWLRELRKQNATVVFVTQHLAEILNSEIKHIVLNNCKTKFFLPNHHANDPLNAELYQQIGLTETQRQIIKHAIPKKEYYYTSPVGNRLLDFTLGPLALSFMGVDGQIDRDHIENLMQKHGEQWCSIWLQDRGLPQWSTRLQQLQKTIGGEQCAS